MSTFGTRVLTEPVSQWFTNKPLTLTPRDVDRSSAVTVAADATKDVKGAWTEIIASTTEATNFVYLSLGNTTSSGNNTGMLLDLAIGGSGSESVVIADIPCGFQAPDGPIFFNFPFFIPAGSRVSVRCAAYIASDTVNVQITTADLPGFVGSNLIETFGATATDSRGTNLPTSNTYVEFVASTSRQYRAIVVVACGGGPNPTISFNGETSVYTLGIGSSGSEVDVMTQSVLTITAEGILQARGTRTNIYAPESPIAAGNRLAVKQSIGRAYRDAIIFGVV
jgi:hypothetical protein